MQEANVSTDHSILATGTNRSDELTIHTRSSHHHPSAMSEVLKEKKRVNSPSLVELFEQTLQEKGGFDSSRTNWINHEEVEINGLSRMTLHRFILEAEKLGKTITYTETLTVKVSD